MCLAMAAGESGSVTAVEIYEHRAELVKELAERLDIRNVDVVCEDGRAFASDALYDRVLCDVPCSGYGEISSKPEMRSKDPFDTDGLPELQMQLLENGAGMLKSGGLLVYSTCTVFREENEDTVNRFLETHPDFKGYPISAESDHVTEISPYERKFLPCEGLHEGFYVALLTKI